MIIIVIIINIVTSGLQAVSFRCLLMLSEAKIVESVTATEDALYFGTVPTGTSGCVKLRLHCIRLGHPTRAGTKSILNHEIDES